MSRRLGRGASPPQVVYRLELAGLPAGASPAIRLEASVTGAGSPAGFTIPLR